MIVFEKSEHSNISVFLQNMTTRPGVYQMLDVNGTVIYVGKAKNLKKRISSYFSCQNHSPKQKALLAHLQSIHITLTHTEGEALLLESQLIKRYHPRYNIHLRDDKTYPFLYVSTHHAFPRLALHRGAKSKEGRYFGPYPNVDAAKESLKLLQKIFPIRQCIDSFFKHRSRPCLQYQIGRCNAPCVGFINETEYKEEVEHTLSFLEGDGRRLIDTLVQRMEHASERLAFEKAAYYRDQIAHLRVLLEKQYVYGEWGNIDIIACVMEGENACLQLAVIRGGMHIGSQAFFPSPDEDVEPSDVIQAFLSQYYLNKPVPDKIIISHPIKECALFTEVLKQQSGHPVQIAYRLRGEYTKPMQRVVENAKEALMTKLASRSPVSTGFLALDAFLGYTVLPRRLECFDVSHTQGEQTVASCIVFDEQGPVRSAYRRFNITPIVGGDDCGAIMQAVTRRYLHNHDPCLLPGIIVIDGGRGQVNAAYRSLLALGITSICLLGIAKGTERKPGTETCILQESSEPLVLSPHSPVFRLFQYARDEAHRFALTGHRHRRTLASRQSALEGIVGLGPKRRHRLLKQFGGLREVSRASVDALNQVEGISAQLAQRIYNAFHDEQES